MLLDLAYYGNPILRKKTAPVKEINNEIRLLIKNMFKTMEANNGMGLAAPQIKQSLALFIVQVPYQEDDETWKLGEPYVFINPKILEKSNEQNLRAEGCLSLPKLHGNVWRPLKIKVEALNERGEQFVKEFEGWEARTILHEYDHIEGILYIDHISKKARRQIEKGLKEIEEKYST